MQKMFADWLKKQGGNVVLLSIGIIALYYDFAGRTAEMKAIIARQEQRINQQMEDISRCHTERARLESRVEWLVSELSQRFPKLKSAPE